MRARVLAVLVALLAVLATPARAQRPDERWKRIAHDGFDAPVWVHHVVNGAASATGYGALRLVGVKPEPAAYTVAIVGVGLHVRGWIMGEYRPSGDWAFDLVVRGGPAAVLAACEQGRRSTCALSVAGLLGAYFVLLPQASP